MRGTDFPKPINESIESDKLVTGCIQTLVTGCVKMSGHLPFAYPHEASMLAWDWMESVSSRAFHFVSDSITTQTSGDTTPCRMTVESLHSHIRYEEI